MSEFAGLAIASAVILGHIGLEKRPDRAIEFACETGMRLPAVAKVGPVDQA